MRAEHPRTPQVPTVKRTRPKVHVAYRSKKKLTTDFIAPLPLGFVGTAIHLGVANLLSGWTVTPASPSPRRSGLGRYIDAQAAIAKPRRTRRHEADPAYCWRNSLRMASVLAQELAVANFTHQSKGGQSWSPSTTWVIHTKALFFGVLSFYF